MPMKPKTTGQMKASPKPKMNPFINGSKIAKSPRPQKRPAKK